MYKIPFKSQDYLSVWIQIWIIKILSFDDADVRVAVKNKVPLVRSLTLTWVAFCIETSNKATVLKLHKEYVPICMEVSNNFILPVIGLLICCCVFALICISSIFSAWMMVHQKYEMPHFLSWLPLPRFPFSELVFFFTYLYISRCSSKVWMYRWLVWNPWNDRLRN